MKQVIQNFRSGVLELDEVPETIVKGTVCWCATWLRSSAPGPRRWLSTWRRKGCSSATTLTFQA
jgi:hypothetical protein